MHFDSHSEVGVVCWDRALLISYPWICHSHWTSLFLQFRFCIFIVGSYHSLWFGIAIRSTWDLGSYRTWQSFHKPSCIPTACSYCLSSIEIDNHPNYVNVIIRGSHWMVSNSRKLFCIFMGHRHHVMTVEMCRVWFQPNKYQIYIERLIRNERPSSATRRWQKRLLINTFPLFFNINPSVFKIRPASLPPDTNLIAIMDVIHSHQSYRETLSRRETILNMSDHCV